LAGAALWFFSEQAHIGEIVCRDTRMDDKMNNCCEKNGKRVGENKGHLKSRHGSVRRLESLR